MPSDRDNWIARGRPIETGRDLVFALAEVQQRAKAGSRWWYMLNKFQREAMDAADAEERGLELFRRELNAKRKA